MKKLKQKSKGVRKYLILLTLMTISLSAMATTADAPWLSVFDKLMNILVGPTARIIAILAVALVGLKMIFGQMEEGGKQGMKAAMGIALMFFASTWVPSFFGYSGSVLIG
ncbi:TrbC/VirB2 family protein [Fusobacterium ulcerans]|uniref:TrbC/VirB2 family protein n=1 Tax=Fusobacterium ulcerans TaxID=861 RepID=UPI000BBAC574|nr:TrbC/VirB2 family protein [Fusobacterium ulcerans]MCB8566325.1 TrbC/VirB2 family protein [Fusobacterium ulcerans]MCB8650372.1 TrbC/VirB2 family protein [Fusobacterium ulcerans]BBA53204.1 conjugal transfer protein TrbC [Fusobacterium varium]